MTSTNEIIDLPRSIGRLLASSTGARMASLPYDLAVAEAVAIVRAANAVRPAVEPAYAILMTRSPVPGDVLKVSPHEAPKYREGDRLLVVHGVHTDLASNANTFVELLSPSWPESTSGALSLESVATTCLDGLALTRRDEVSKLLERQLLILKEAYLALGSGANSWNSLWWRHVTRGLERLGSVIAAAPDSAVLDDYVLGLIPACFGLPAEPAPARDAKRVAGLLSSALREWWRDDESAADAASAVERRRQEFSPDGPASPTEEFGEIDGNSAASGSVLFAWHSALGSEHSVAWLARLSWQDLMSPFGEAGHEQLTFLSDGVQCASAAISGELSYISTDIDDGHVVSEFVTVRFPLAAQVPNEVTSSNVNLRTSPRSVSFEGRFEIVDGLPSLRGHFRAKLSSFVPRIITARIEIPSGDVLSGVVVPTASGQIVLMHPDSPTVVVSALAKGGLSGRPSFTVLQDDDDGDQVVEMPGGSGHRFIVCVPASTARATIGNSKAQMWPNRETYVTADVHEAALVVHVGDSQAEFRVKARSGGQRFLPLLATIDGVPARDGEPPEEAATEIRGCLETDMAGRLHDPDDSVWLQGLGHYLLPEGEVGGSGELAAHHGGIWLTAAEWATRDFKSDHLPSVPQELLSSGAAEAFRQSFRALGIAETVKSGWESGRSWVSRIDHSRLWNTLELARYLETYQELLDEARRLGDPGGVFWAAYPFCASVWTIDGVAQLRSILISPLHPIRLAWLSGISAGVTHEADEQSRRRFAGTIEGWNFPHFGPAETATSHVLAVPADHGPEQLFLGWSMLVRAPDQMAPLRVPGQICGIRAPGSSLSGLNGTSVSKAMGDFRRINPFLSTLTVDLAATSPTARMAEIDAAVIDELARWASDEDDALTGGARVWDSTLRSGDLPKDQVSVELSGRGRPLTWSRYNPSKAEPPAANLRILQDAGHVVHVTKGVGQRLSSVGQYPFRRHEVLTVPDEGVATVDAFPGLRTGAGWAPFVGAVTLLEQCNLGDQDLIVRAALSSGGLFGGRADWTITGDSMVNPSALAGHLAGGEAPMALWEWQPPFLAATKAADPTLLERRPYLSVVKVPAALSARINSLMSKSWGSDLGVKPQDVLKELGSRGIGLSSLMAIGGTQAIGALGFFVTLKLLDTVHVDDGEILVLPIDACDQYLTALSGEEHELGDRKRADLLLIHLSATGVSLVPIEIKYYKIGSPSPNLPAQGATALHEPMKQLASTQAVLRGLSLLPEGALWRSAFASLVEVGMRLNPAALRDRGEAADLLARLANGELPIRVGKPLLTYYSHGSESFRLDRATWAEHLGIEQHGELVADASAVAGALFGHGATNALVAGWQDLVKWALSDDVDSEVVRDGHQRTPDQERVMPEPRSELASAASPSAQLETDMDADSDVVRDSVETADHSDEGPDGNHEQSVAKPPPAPEGVRFVVGDLVDQIGGGDAFFWPANTALTQLNMGVVGNLGTGKTQLLKSMVKNLRDGSRLNQPNPISMLILDYKGDFVSPDFVEAVGGRVLSPHRLPLNYFELSGPYSATAAVRKAGSFNEVLSQIFNIGPKQQNTLRRVILDLFSELGTAPTMSEVLTAYKEQADYDSVVGVLEGWVLGEVFAERGQGLSSLDELIDDRVVILNLLEFGSDQNSKNALVAMFLNLYYEYMARLKKWPYVGESPQLRRLNSFLLVDEATNIMTYNFDSLNSLMLQGREFGVGVILSSQYLSHFKSSKFDYAQALRTWFVHSVPNVTAAQLQALGLPNSTDATAKRIVGLPTHHALYSSLGCDGKFVRGMPFYELVRGLGEGGAASE